MAQNTRVQKFQKLRSDIEQMDDANFKTPIKNSPSLTESKLSPETHIPDVHPIADPITRGAISIPLDELMKNHTKMTNDDSFVTEEQAALEEQKSKTLSIIGTIATILIVVSLVVGIAFVLWRFLQ